MSYYWINSYPHQAGIKVETIAAHLGRRLVTDLNTVLESDNERYTIQITKSVINELQLNTSDRAKQVLSELQGCLIKV